MHDSIRAVHAGHQTLTELVQLVLGEFGTERFVPVEHIGEVLAGEEGVRVILSEDDLAEHGQHVHRRHLLVVLVVGVGLLAEESQSSGKHFGMLEVVVQHVEQEGEDAIAAETLVDGIALHQVGEHRAGKQGELRVVGEIGLHLVDGVDALAVHHLRADGGLGGHHGGGGGHALEDRDDLDADLLV